MSEYRISIWQDGIEVASVHGSDLDRVHAEAMHYAFVYAQDGPIEVRGIPPEHFDSLKHKLASA